MQYTVNTEALFNTLNDFSRRRCTVAVAASAFVYTAPSVYPVL